MAYFINNNLIFRKKTGIIFAVMGLGNVFFNFFMTLIVNPYNQSATIEIYENN